MGARVIFLKWWGLNPSKNYVCQGFATICLLTGKNIEHIKKICRVLYRKTSPFIKINKLLVWRISRKI